MYLETERLILRKFSEEDWKCLYEYLSKENVVKFEPYDIYSEDECMEEAVNRSRNEAFCAVCLKENNKLIGNIYFKQQEPKEFMTWEIGYVFNPLYYSKGYATEASKRILKYGFEQIGVRRIIAKCNPENSASWKLLDRLSMRLEGHLKKPVYFKKTIDGKAIWHDCYQYAMLEEEWFDSTK